MLAPVPHRDELEEVTGLTAAYARAYLAQLDAAPVRTPGGELEGAAALAGALPDRGVGAAAALRELIEHGEPGLARRRRRWRPTG
jgi:hypothetical protein